MHCLSNATERVHDDEISSTIMSFYRSVKFKHYRLSARKGGRGLRRARTEQGGVFHDLARDLLRRIPPNLSCDSSRSEFQTKPNFGSSKILILTTQKSKVKTGEFSTLKLNIPKQTTSILHNSNTQYPLMPFRPNPA